MLIVDWDLEAGYEYVLNKFEFIDPDRTVALGASYGGYMVPPPHSPAPSKRSQLVCISGHVLILDQLDPGTPVGTKIQSSRLVFPESISPHKHPQFICDKLLSTRFF